MENLAYSFLNKAQEKHCYNYYVTAGIYYFIGGILLTIAEFLER